MISRSADSILISPISDRDDPTNQETQMKTTFIFAIAVLVT